MCGTRFRVTVAQIRNRVPLHCDPTTATHARQREEAARNEARILEATRALLRDDDAGAVEIRDVARAAGVGVGTVYRRFGDKAGLLAAVIGADERVLQDAL